MRRRVDKSMVKLYKDGLVFKRNINDLKQSITETLYGFRYPLNKHPASIQTKKKLCFKCGIFHQPAAPHHCVQYNFKCPNCSQSFSSADKRQKHLQTKHYQCKLCHDKPAQVPAVHDAELCGQKRLDCQRCGAKVKRKDLDEHVTRCCFQSCLKCKKQVYYKAFAYHLNRCITVLQIYQQNQRKNQDLQQTYHTTRINKKQQNPYTSKTNRFLPCSIQL